MRRRGVSEAAWQDWRAFSRHRASVISPELAAATIVPAFVAAIIGGFDSLLGAILGGLILGLLETYTAAYISGSFKSSLTFVILLGVLLFKPEGLFAQKSMRRV